MAKQSKTGKTVVTFTRAKQLSAQLRALRKNANSWSEVARAGKAKAAYSTILRWGKSGNVPMRAESLKRAEKIIERARPNLIVDQKEVRSLIKELKQSEDAVTLARLASDSGHSFETVQGWRDRLKEKPTPEFVKTVSRAFKQADERIQLEKSGNLYRYTPEGKKKVSGHYRDYVGARPPKFPKGKAPDAYVLFGLNREGKVISSTTYGGDYKTAVWDFRHKKKKGEYKPLRRPPRAGAPKIKRKKRISPPGDVVSTVLRLVWFK